MEMQDYDGFTKIFKYGISSKKLTPLENFITELFVFVLNYLKQSNITLFYDVLSLFGITKKHINVRIFTQNKVQNKKYIPDIYIETNKENFIIEVKINSPLKTYPIANGRRINQYELYLKEYKNTKVNLLTKHLIFENNIPEKNKILWNEVYGKMKSSKDYLIQSFLYILEENGMANTKIDKSFLKAIGSIINWKKLIEDSWCYGKKYSLSPLALNKQNDDYWIRYNIRDKKKKQNLLYIGTISEEPDTLYVYMCREAIKQFKKFYGKKNKDDKTLLEYYDLNKLFTLSGEEQKKELEKFFKKVMVDKLKLV